MKIDEAIKIKELHYIADNIGSSEEYDEADRLSIEALKRVKDNPYIARHYLRALLPGESK